MKVYTYIVVHFKSLDIQLLSKCLHTYSKQIKQLSHYSLLCNLKFQCLLDLYISTDNRPKTLSICMHDNDNDGLFKFTYLRHCIPSWQCFCSSLALC